MLGLCKLDGPITYLVLLLVTFLVLLFPGHDPHAEPHDADNLEPGQHNWISPGIRLLAVSASQLRLLVMALLGFWRAYRLHGTPTREHLSTDG